MRIAIVGTGISALTSAHHLAKEHDVELFEATNWVGGHTHTVDVEVDGSSYAVDTGFIVFNKHTYPHYLNLIQELGVPYQESCMSFSVKCDKTGLEYNGTSFDALFAQRRNLLNIQFWRMLGDIYRFYRGAEELLISNDQRTLGEFLKEQRYSAAFIEKHIVPMAAAVWSAPPSQMMAFPLRYLLRFFHNHGFTKVNDRPQWYVIKGGSREYVKVLSKPLLDRIHLNSPVQEIRRFEDRVELTIQGEVQTFDQVVIACHSDTALQLLRDPSDAERSVLGAIPYQKNDVVLHRDASIMPEATKAWASWNYRLPKEGQGDATVTYWMNRLQGFSEDTPDFFVSLNQNDAIDPSKVLRTFVYHHPVYTDETLEAQKRHHEISGVNRTHYCGAYWFYGFHEDGVKSGLRVVAGLQGTTSDVRDWAA